MLVGLFKQLERILALADMKIYEETEELEDIIRRMFEVMDRVARSSCDYVEHGRQIYSGLGSANHHSRNCRPEEDRRNGNRIDPRDQ